MASSPSFSKQRMFVDAKGFVPVLESGCSEASHSHIVEQCLVVLYQWVLLEDTIVPATGKTKAP